MASHIVVATFDNRNQAYDTAYDIDQLDDRNVDFKSGALVEKNRLGHVTTLDTRNLGSAWVLAGNVGGALLGILIGALAGPAGVAVGSAAGAAAASGPAAGGLLGGAVGATADVAEWGLKQGTIDEVSAMLLPGRTALVMEVEEGSTNPIDTAVRRRGSIVYRTPVGT
jgi:uncharacterized membrane protein